MRIYEAHVGMAGEAEKVIAGWTRMCKDEPTKTAGACLPQQKKDRPTRSSPAPPKRSTPLTT